MIAVVQRVTAARVVIAGETVGEIGRGLCVLASVVTTDTEADLRWMVDKLTTLRVFPGADAEKAFDQDVRQINGGLLLVSNFTVSAHCRRGRRPSFSPAMPPAQADPVFERFVILARTTGLPVATGRFGADMAVAIENDGPATFVLDSNAQA